MSFLESFATPVSRRDFWKKFNHLLLGATALASGCANEKNFEEERAEYSDSLTQGIEDLRIKYEIKRIKNPEIWKEAIQKAKEGGFEFFGKEEIEKLAEEQKKVYELKKDALILAIILHESGFNNSKEGRVHSIYFNKEFNTAGSMQVSVDRAREEMGASFYGEAIREISSVEGGIEYGVRYLQKIAEIYDYLEDEEMKLMCILADYNAGAYASRNASIQKFLNDNAQTNLKIDGLIRTETINDLQNFFDRENININVSEDISGSLGTKELENTETWKKLVKLNDGKKLVPTPAETSVEVPVILRVVTGKKEKSSKEYASRVYGYYQEILEILKKATKEKEQNVKP